MNHIHRTLAALATLAGARWPWPPHPPPWPRHSGRRHIATAVARRHPSASSSKAAWPAGRSP